MKSYFKPFVAAVFVLSWCAPVFAQSAASAPGVRGAILRQIDTEAQKFISLAEAIPAEKYSWRPAEGVRSVGEVVAHVAADNYFIPSAIGASVPQGLDIEHFEQTKAEKEIAIQTVKDSFDHLRMAVGQVNDADLEKTVEMFGQKSTPEDALIMTAGHVSEHLGQLIAYARMNGIVPPWSK